ncbi:MAG: glycosyltransferase family 2 protein [Caldilineaceae bacterium]|nr:glycosyltransferase family 2 protein [Caldilineaceae bacterium]
MDSQAKHIQLRDKIADAHVPVSVVVLTRNRAPSLARTLAAVRAQSYLDFEIVVVDNGSTDQTADVARAYRARRIEVDPRFGIGHCRGVGVNAAQGELIAFCDDDCVPSRDWLAALVARMTEDARIALVGGKVINIGFTGYRRFKGRTKLARNGGLNYAHSDEETEFYGNMNVAMRRQTILEIGGYDPFLTVLEEIDLATRVRRSGYRVEYEPLAVLEHHNAGVFFKSRRFFYGVQLMRLYFYVKHHRPESSGGWLEFARYEMGLLVRDLIRVARSFGAALLHAKPERLPIIGVELFNLFSARLALPWLLYQAQKRANWERTMVDAQAALQPDSSS